jgi:HK97 family phage portal protein
MSAIKSFIGSIAQKMLGSRVFSAILYGNGYTDYTRWNKRTMVEQAYERNPVNAAITDRIAGLTANLPIYVECDSVNGKRVQSYSHPILDVLNRSDGGAKQLIDTVSRFLDVTGEGYLQKLIVGDRVVGLVILPSQYTNPIQGTPYNPIKGYEYLQYQRVTLEADQVIYIRRQSLSEYWHGNSQTIASAEVIDFQNAAITWNKNLSKRGGAPPFVVKMPGATASEVQAYKEAWMQINGGANNVGAPAVDTGDTTSIATGNNFKPNEMELVKGIELATRMIAMRRGFPSELLNDPSGKTYANVSEATKTLYRDIVIPQGELIYDAISRDLGKYYRDNPKICIDFAQISALSEDRKQLIERVIRATGTPVMTVNEGREELKLTETGKPEHNEIGKPAQGFNASEKPEVNNLNGEV